jgi:hypothetical protein
VHKKKEAAHGSPKERTFLGRNQKSMISPNEGKTVPWLLGRNTGM